MMPMLQRVKFGFIWRQWMANKDKNKSYRKKESARREVDRLVDSLDFEPVNFNETLCWLRRLMCLL